MRSSWRIRIATTRNGIRREGGITLEGVYTLFEKPRDSVSFDSMRIRIASPEKIRQLVVRRSEEA